jgi:CDGSH-type Zn-finger protein
VVSNNGPLYAEGDLQVDGAGNDMPGVRYRVALCRCGDSKNKPFCDNTHEQADFRDRGAVGETGPGFESTGGPLEIKRAPNGPLLLTGNLTVVTGAGRAAWKGTKAALCRCGKSQNKPFCDGAHVDAGFEAD